MIPVEHIEPIFPFDELHIEVQHIISKKYLDPLASFMFGFTSKKNRDLVLRFLNGKRIELAESIGVQIGTHGYYDCLDWILDSIPWLCDGTNLLLLVFQCSLSQARLNELAAFSTIIDEHMVKRLVYKGRRDLSFRMDDSYICQILGWSGQETMVEFCCYAFGFDEERLRPWLRGVELEWAARSGHVEFIKKRAPFVEKSLPDIIRGAVSESRLAVIDYLRTHHNLSFNPNDSDEVIRMLPPCLSESQCKCIVEYWESHGIDWATAEVAKRSLSLRGAMYFEKRFGFSKKFVTDDWLIRNLNDAIGKFDFKYAIYFLQNRPNLLSQWKDSLHQFFSYLSFSSVSKLHLNQKFLECLDFCRLIDSLGYEFSEIQTEIDWDVTDETFNPWHCINLALFLHERGAIIDIGYIVTRLIETTPNQRMNKLPLGIRSLIRKTRLQSVGTRELLAIFGRRTCLHESLLRAFVVGGKPLKPPPQTTLFNSFFDELVFDPKTFPDFLSMYQKGFGVLTANEGNALFGLLALRGLNNASILDLLKDFFHWNIAHDEGIYLSIFDQAGAIPSLVKSFRPSKFIHYIKFLHSRGVPFRSTVLKDFLLTYDRMKQKVSESVVDEVDFIFQILRAMVHLGATWNEAWNAEMKRMKTFSIGQFDRHWNLLKRSARKAAIEFKENRSRNPNKRL